MSDLKLLTKELPTQSTDYLSEQLGQFKRELFNLRFQKTLGELKNTSRFLLVRRAVARLKTELTSRKLKGS